MNALAGDWELRCPHCSHVERCGPARMLQRLQQLGMLRRQGNPDPDLLLELLSGALPRLTCHQCGQSGLALEQFEEDDWESTRACQGCGRPIAAERLDALPDTTWCADCAGRRVQPQEEADYCPKCGAVMSLRSRSRGGVTRYELSCPDCR